MFGQMLEGDDERSVHQSLVSWQSGPPVRGVTVGHCSWCNTLHLMCPDCLEVTGIPEEQFDTGIWCLGQCGRIYCASYSRDGEISVDSWDGLDISLLTSAHGKPTDRLTEREVERLIAETKWQHWSVAHPTISLTEVGLMQWRDDFLCLTDKGKALA